MLKLADFGKKKNTEKLKLEDALFKGFTRKESNITWFTDREIVYREPDGTLMIYNIESKWKSIIASNASLVSTKSIIIFFSFLVDVYGDK